MNLNKIIIVEEDKPFDKDAPFYYVRFSRSLRSLSVDRYEESLECPPESTDEELISEVKKTAYGNDETIFTIKRRR